MKTICSSGFQVSASDMKSWNNYLLKTPEEWTLKALKGLINKATKTIIKDSTKKLMDDETVDEFPADNDALINFVCARPDYKTRAECEAIK